MNVQEIASKYKDYLIEKRRFFHQYPEVSTKEYNTSKAIKEELDKIGVSWRPCGLETGILVSIQGAKPGQDHPAPGRHGRPDGPGDHRRSLCQQE